MKQKFLWTLLFLATAAQGAAPAAETPIPPALQAAPQETRAAHLSANVLNRHHYNVTPLDANLSAKIFDQYLKALDSEKVFFVQSDIDPFLPFRTRLNEAILNENLTVPFAMFNLYQKRAAQRYAYSRALLKIGFDFQKDETYQLARDKASWAKTEAEMSDLWRKRVKSEWLRLKLAGKDDKSIVALLDKRYDSLLKRIGRVRSMDAFQIFMNAYTMSIEPHTNYLGPRAVQEFNISMRLSLVGIGAALAELDDFVTIRDLIAGGPAILSGQLKIGDRIVGVAQGEAGPMTDILGWRVDDAVTLIRGTPDSIVRLEILPADATPEGKHKVVSLVRKTISLESRAAKASIHSANDGKTTRRIGVISLPTFYEDFAGKQKGLKDYRSATRDVARLLENLKKEKVDSVLIDLRNNGGGSMGEAIELTGMFIDKGPVVQQRGAKGEISVGRDNHEGVAWDGPLGVLINRRSASSSEIFAAAIQDYGRGLIIGESSFGKGTVQTLVNLDRIAKNAKPIFGELKMTIAQFFRVNGGTTQLRGVTPDILFPAVNDPVSIGESSFANALPWTQIKPADYVAAGDVKSVLPVLMAQHEARVKLDKAFKYLQEDIAESRQRSEKNMISLNEAQRRAEQTARESRLAARESQRAEAGGEGSTEGGAEGGTAGGTAATPEGRDSAREKVSGSRDDGLRQDERPLVKELAAEKARKQAKDVLLDEAVRILGDAVGLLPAGAGLAARGKPEAAAMPN